MIVLYLKEGKSALLEKRLQLQSSESALLNITAGRFLVYLNISQEILLG